MNQERPSALELVAQNIENISDGTLDGAILRDLLSAFERYIREQTELTILIKESNKQSKEVRAQIIKDHKISFEL